MYKGKLPETPYFLECLPWEVYNRESLPHRASRAIQTVCGFLCKFHISILGLESWGVRTSNFCLGVLHQAQLCYTPSSRFSQGLRPSFCQMGRNQACTTFCGVGENVSKEEVTGRAAQGAGEGGQPAQGKV